MLNGTVIECHFSNSVIFLNITFKRSFKNVKMFFLLELFGEEPIEFAKYVYFFLQNNFLNCSFTVGIPKKGKTNHDKFCKTIF